MSFQQMKHTFDISDKNWKLQNLYVLESTYIVYWHIGTHPVTKMICTKGLRIQFTPQNLN